MATILIVEDDLLLADCYMQWLSTTRHKTQHVTDAQSAIDAIDDASPDVILLDMLLPGASGVQVLHTLRSHADLSHIPILLCSSAVPSDTKNLTEYGVRAVLNKSSLTRRSLCTAVEGV